MAYGAWRGGRCVVLFVSCFLLLVACSFPGSVKPTVKIGLSAPFEGLYRDQGYEALHAVRLAVRQRNGVGGVGGSYLVELVALNDFNEPNEAILQARKMAVDPGVLGVVGGWSPDTARLAAPEYERLGLALLVPDAGDVTPLAPEPVDPAFVDGFEALSGGASPGPLAVWAYAAANRLLDALDAVARVEGLTRAGVRTALGTDVGR
jgi:ABC-type branched-subunit amino acid transport system substrate-binding protein